jgi:predicted nucleic acid-binding protein
MSLPSCLTNETSPIVLDASVAINLAASRIGAAILRTLPCPILIASNAVEELERGRSTGRREIDDLTQWASDDLIEVVSLNDASVELFASLVIGPAADTLDDGEAATIAIAFTAGAIPVIDERKANRLCDEQFQGRSKAATMDLFAHAAILSTFSSNELAEAVFSALSGARMRVLPRHVEWTIGLIGRDRAASCESLPRSVRQRLVG